jgi:hypothetical protein
MDKNTRKESAMKATHMTTLALVAALIGFAATVAWADGGRSEARVAEGIHCACIGQGNVA